MTFTCTVTKSYYLQSPDHDDDEAGDEIVRQECLEIFGARDYIMEPGVFGMLKM